MKYWFHISNALAGYYTGKFIGFIVDEVVFEKSVSLDLFVSRIYEFSYNQINKAEKIRLKRNKTRK